MKVKDLIESLNGFNPNANIGVKTIDDEYVGHLYVSYMYQIPHPEVAYFLFRIQFSRIIFCSY